MQAGDCLQILREIKDVSFASVDEQGNPQVRIIDVMLVEDEKLYFCTSRGKDFHRQLLQHPQIAITGMNSAYQMVRLQGRSIRLSQQEYWIHRIFDENPSMKDVYPGNSFSILDAFVVCDAQLEFFDLGRQPIERRYFTIGEASMPKKGKLYSSLSAAVHCVWGTLPYPAEQLPALRSVRRGLSCSCDHQKIKATPVSVAMRKMCEFA